MVAYRFRIFEWSGRTIQFCSSVVRVLVLGSSLTTHDDLHGKYGKAYDFKGLEDGQMRLPLLARLAGSAYPIHSTDRDKSKGTTYIAYCHHGMMLELWGRAHGR